MLKGTTIFLLGFLKSCLICLLASTFHLETIIYRAAREIFKTHKSENITSLIKQSNRTFQWLPITLGKSSKIASKVCCALCDLDPRSLCSAPLALSVLLQSTHVNFLQSLQHTRNVYTSQTLPQAGMLVFQPHDSHSHLNPIFAPK